jgi:type II secretory pathway pseudopilin PulG
VVHYVLFMAILATVVFIATLPVGKIMAYYRDASEARRQAGYLRAEAAAMRERARSKQSLVEVERAARESLALSLPNEIVFVPVEGPWPAPGEAGATASVRASKNSPRPAGVSEKAVPKPSAAPSPGSAGVNKSQPNSDRGPAKPKAGSTPRPSPTPSRALLSGSRP